MPSVSRNSPAIEDTAAAGFPNVITFSGNRAGLSDEEGIANTVAGTKRVIGLAEQRGVTVVIEVLNSKISTPTRGTPTTSATRWNGAARSAAASAPRG